MGGRLGLAFLTAATLGLVVGCTPEFDVVLEGGTVVDGTGAPSRVEDVGIRDGRIVAMGSLGDRKASRRLDAVGLVVAPGFIDVHSHAAPALATPDLAAATPLLAQGITTVFGNPDGGGPVDLAAQRRELERVVPGVNVALLVPHGSIRRAVIGLDDRQATPAELDTMEALVGQGKADGAFGLSSGLFYTPGSFADLSEVIALASVFGNSGVYTSHIRDESDYSIGLLAAVDEVIEVARGSGARSIVTHIKALGPHLWGSAPEVIARIDAARQEGLAVWADQYPYEASATGLTALVSRSLLAGGHDSLLVRFEKMPGVMRDDIVRNLERRGGAERIQFRRFELDPSIEGQTLAEVAEARGLHPVDAAVILLRAGGAGIVSHNMAPTDVEAFMSQPWVMTSSDGGLVPMGEGVPHPRNYGSFPRKLAHYVRERRLLSLEGGVRSMTGLPADVMSLPEGRGYLRVGSVADIVVFDPDTVGDRATYTEPHQLSEGVRYVLISGNLALEHGVEADQRFGRVLRPD